MGNATALPPGAKIPLGGGVVARVRERAVVLLVVVGPFQDGECAVNLLEEDNQRHLVGKGHRGE